jgi:hypothetical protein
VANLWLIPLYLQQRAQTNTKIKLLMFQQMC